MPSCPAGLFTFTFHGFKMDFETVVFSRYSARMFKPDAVPSETIERILESLSAHLRGATASPGNW